MGVRMFAIRVFAAAVLVAVASSSARAQEDADGSKDHPMLSRFPGYYIEEYEAQDFSAYEFELPDGKVQKVEGRRREDYLVTNFGVAGDRLSTTGLGDTKPVADNATEQGRAQNRRVELVRR